MFYAGIHCDDDTGDCFAVVVEKVLRNARKEYPVTQIRRFSKESLVVDLRKLYDDPLFLRKKKVFSQDRRPPKNTFTPPHLIVSVKSGDMAPVLAAREEGLPVDGFFLRDEPGWAREEPKILRYGVNLYVGRDSLEKTAGVLASSSMVWPEGDGTDMTDLRSEIARCMNEKTEKGCCPSSVSPFMLALMTAVWHCETIRPIKRYGGG